MKVLRAAVILGVSTPLVVLACGSDDGAITPRGAAGESGEGGEAAGGANAGGSSSGTAGTAASGGELTSGGASDAGAGGAAGGGGVAGATSGGAGGVGMEPEPEPECGDAAIEGGLVCFDAPLPLTLLEGTPTDVAVGDWDGGNGLDLIVASSAGLSYFANDFVAGFTSDTYEGTPGTVLGLGRLDVAGDELDLLLAQSNSSNTIVAFGDGEGGVTISQNNTFNAEGTPFNYFVADVDGTPASDDIVVTFPNSVHVVPTTGMEGEGFIGPGQIVTTSPSNPKDGVLVKLGTSQWLVYSTQGNLERKEVTYAADQITLSEEPVVTLAGGTTGQLDVGDFNEDGFDDLAVTLSASGALNVLFGDGVGSGSFAVVTGSSRFLTLTVGETDADKTQRDVKVGDFNGDEHADVAVSVQGLDAIAIFTGDGEGHFSEPKLISTGVGSGPNRLAVGDLDDDGVDDLVAVATSNSKVVVLLSDP